MTKHLWATDIKLGSLDQTALGRKNLRKNKQEYGKGASSILSVTADRGTCQTI